MPEIASLDKIAINVKSHKLLRRLMKENPQLEEIMQGAHNETEALIGVRDWVMRVLKKRPAALRFHQSEHNDLAAFDVLEWRDYAAIRLLDYIDNAGRVFEDLNLRGQAAVSNPIKLIWLGVNYGTGGAKPAFFEDMLHLFRQFTGRSHRTLPTREQIEEWMDRFPTGLDPRIVKLREENRDRILTILMEKIESGEIRSSRYRFDPGMSYEHKLFLMASWWDDARFHLRFAVRSPELLNELLGFSLDPDTMQVLYEAREAGIPFFVNPYYLSLLHVRVPYFATGADLAIRDYVVYSRQLVEEFGNIVAWEKEDQVEPGKPNAAGWILPSRNSIHRRYPEVAILIPDTVGRACGGLCASCQRMYDFQSGHLNFNLDALEPNETWDEKLQRLMRYFEEDSQLRDILITGGDGLMSSDESLKDILDAILAMTDCKLKRNERRPDGARLAGIVRVRIGTRLPVYLPQRITPELLKILREFRESAMKLGVRQFLIQSHFNSPMEITPEAMEAVKRLHSAGWTVTNQQVFSAAASRRGHTTRLREVLNEIDVLPYYTFTVKGYMENNHNFAPNSRAVQEQVEEKVFGTVPEEQYETLSRLSLDPEQLPGKAAELRAQERLPFLATDRSVLNLPGVGKSLTFRTIGITRYGRRILEFDHDATRSHSPIIHRMGKVVIIESKSISEYLEQLEAMGEDPGEYESLYGYSIGQTERRIPLYEYPDYDYEVTAEFTNLDVESVSACSRHDEIPE